MLNYFIPLLSSFVSSDIWVRYFIPVFALCFLATVPKTIRYIVNIGGR